MTLVAFCQTGRRFLQTGFRAHAPAQHQDHGGKAEQDTGANQDGGTAPLRQKVVAGETDGNIEGISADPLEGVNAVNLVECRFKMHDTFLIALFDARMQWVAAANRLIDAVGFGWNAHDQAGIVAASPGDDAIRPDIDGIDEGGEVIEFQGRHGNAGKTAPGIADGNSCIELLSVGDAAKRDFGKEDRLGRVLLEGVVVAAVLCAGRNAEFFALGNVEQVALPVDDAQTRDFRKVAGQAGQLLVQLGGIAGTRTDAKRLKGNFLGQRLQRGLGSAQREIEAGFQNGCQIAGIGSGQSGLILIAAPQIQSEERQHPQGQQGDDAKALGGGRGAHLCVGATAITLSSHGRQVAPSILSFQAILRSRSRAALVRRTCRYVVRLSIDKYAEMPGMAYFVQIYRGYFDDFGPF